LIQRNDVYTDNSEVLCLCAIAMHLDSSLFL